MPIHDRKLLVEAAKALMQFVEALTEMTGEGYDEAVQAIESIIVPNEAMAAAEALAALASKDI